MEGNNQKKCFIITPIGNEGSEIRRHIDGIIDAALKPVVEGEFNYELEVSHRIDVPGNIPKQVITNVFDSQLVIANLTGNNPNVMYELALRHCFGSVVIIIAEEGTKIPADIVGERTIFYVNDAKGVIELKEKLSNMIRNLEREEEVQQQGPVYDALRDRLNTDNVIKEINKDESVDAFLMLLDKINNLENVVKNNSAISNYARHGSIKSSVSIVVTTEGIDNGRLFKVFFEEIIPIVKNIGIPFSYNLPDDGVFKITFDILRARDYKALSTSIESILYSEGATKVSIGYETKY